MKKTTVGTLWLTLHELRTPVSIIKRVFRNTLEDFENIKEKKRKDFLEKINRNANRLTALSKTFCCLLSLTEIPIL